MKKLFIALVTVLVLSGSATGANAQKRYQGEVSAPIGAVILLRGEGHIANFLAVGLETIHGFRTELSFFGIGVGIHKHILLGEDETYHNTTIPLFINAKFYVPIEQRGAVCFDANVGYDVGITVDTAHGPYVSSTIGYNFELGRKTALNTGLGCKVQSWGDHWWLFGIVAKVGFTW